MIKKGTSVVVVVNNSALAKLLKVEPGAEVSVACRNGVPLSREWRNRLRDMKNDKCITVCQNTKKTKVSPKREEK